MLPIFDGLRDVTLASVTTRMLLAVLCGGLIGHTSAEMLRHYQDVDVDSLRRITDAL